MLILVLDDLGKKAHELLEQSPYIISYDKDDLSKASALIVRSSKVTKEMIDTALSLKIIARAGVGMDTIDQEYALSKNIILCNAQGGNSVNAAETTMGLILCLAHKITSAHHLLFGHKKWERGILHEGFELEGKTLGIIGYGNVGSRVARLAHAFGMNILVYDPYVSDFAEFVVSVEKEFLLKNSDIVTLHVPLTSETKYMINSNEFSLMKPNSHLVNASRGKVVNQEALVGALENKLGSAALDVFEIEPLPTDSPLFYHQNITMIPHLGGASSEARERVSRFAVEAVFENLKNIAENHNI